ncbi:MAG: tRNA epoxyqueuosine(34) reductase QueG [Sandaracinus sp.]
MSTLEEKLRARAEELGFARIGFARAETLGVEGERLRAFLAAGRHGSMAWLEETAEVRIDPRHERMLRSAKSIVVLATPFARTEGDVGPSPGVIARYARGRDYHNVLGKRLKKLASLLRSEGYSTRHSVDSMPVLERAWAERAGVGFIGKNCCLIVPGLGSHVLLSTLVTAAELAPTAPIRERCGECRACLDACPTRAFAGPRELDARRCISYLTIEHAGPIPDELREGMGDRFFGCDLCQDVCPFNRTQPPPASLTAPFAPDARLAGVDAAAILAMSAEAHAAFTLASPLQRPGRAGLARNAAIVLGNRGTRVHLPVLRAAARADAEAVVRDAAAWAITRIEARES